MKFPEKVNLLLFVAIINFLMLIYLIYLVVSNQNFILQNKKNITGNTGLINKNTGLIHK
jgi:hypothetical protein